MEARHDFILVFDGVPDLTDEVADALYEAGCDDGTFMMTSGLFYGAFHRVAPCIDDAVASAVRDVRRANIGAIRASPTRHGRDGNLPIEKRLIALPSLQSFISIRAR